MNKNNQIEKISKKNASFFNENISYRDNVNSIDTYENIRKFQTYYLVHKNY